MQDGYHIAAPKASLDSGCAGGEQAGAGAERGGGAGVDGNAASYREAPGQPRLAGRSAALRHEERTAVTLKRVVASPRGNEEPDAGGCRDPCCLQLRSHAARPETGS